MRREGLPREEGFLLEKLLQGMMIKDIMQRSTKDANILESVASLSL